VLAAPALLALPRAARAQADPYAALLAEEHAAIHLYGVLAPHLPESLRDVARAAYDDHRGHRDTLVALIRAAGGTPPAAKPAYALPFPVGTPALARTLADRIEESLAVRWRDAAGTVDAAARRRCVTAFGDECAHLARYRWALRHSTAEAAPALPLG
jgi:hypothetical protein